MSCEAQHHARLRIVLLLAFSRKIGKGKIWEEKYLAFHFPAMYTLSREVLSRFLCSYRPTNIRLVSTHSALHHQTLRLSDGRTLGFAEIGRPTDYPLIFMHGYPTCRLETIGIEETANKHNLRLITPDRNGYGLTTFDSNRQILDWPVDVEELANHLALSRFAVLGGSGGSPYALACAYRIPRERLSAVGIMGGAGPWEAGSHFMSWPYRITAAAAHNLPSVYRGLLNLMVKEFRRALESPSGVQRVNRLLSNHVGNLEGESIDEIRENIGLQVFEAFRQGAEPAVHDARLLTSDWGIRFENVTYDRVNIWHGTRDRNAPVEMIRWMAERLPNCTLREFDEDTHFTLGHQLDLILSELIPENLRTING